MASNVDTPLEGDPDHALARRLQEEEGRAQHAQGTRAAGDLGLALALQAVFDAEADSEAVARPADNKVHFDFQREARPHARDGKGGACALVGWPRGVVPTAVPCAWHVRRLAGAAPGFLCAGEGKVV